MGNDRPRLLLKRMPKQWWAEKGRGFQTNEQVVKDIFVVMPNSMVTRCAVRLGKILLSARESPILQSIAQSAQGCNSLHCESN